MLTPAWTARAVRLITAEQHIGGPLVGLAVTVVSLATAVIAAAGASVAGFFYSGTAADVLMWLIVAVAARMAYVYWYCQ